MTTTLLAPLSAQVFAAATVHLQLDPVSGAATVACDLARVGLPPVTLTHDADGTIRVSRPAAAHRRGARMGEAFPAEAYVWEGGVPRVSAPGTPSLAPYTRDEAAYGQPIAAALLRAVFARGIVDVALLTAAEQIGADLWHTMWTTLAPHLHARAWRIADTYAARAPLYAVLSQRPDVCDHATIVPAIGPFLSVDRIAALPRDGVLLPEILAHFLPVTAGTRLHAGLVQWLRQVPWTHATLPAFKGTPDERTALMRRFVGTIVERIVRPDPTAPLTLDPNLIGKLDTPDQWRLVNLLLADPTVHGFVGTVLRNPAAAVGAIDRYLPPALRVGTARAQWEIVIGQLRDWAQLHPDEAGRVAGLARACEYARVWHRACVATEQGDATVRDAARDARVVRERAEHDAALAAADAAQAVADAAQDVAARQRTVREAAEYLPFALVPPVLSVAHATHVCRFLPSGAALNAEGAEAQHCIGGSYYRSRGHEQTSVFFTVRGPDNAFLATAEADPKTGQLRQLNGERNDTVPPAVRTFVEAAVRIALGKRPAPATWATIAAPAPLATPQLALPAPV